MVDGVALPNLGLRGFFGLGTDGWDDEMDLNLLMLSALTQGRITAKSDVAPADGGGDALDGQVVLLTAGAQANNIALFDPVALVWRYIVPQEGWLLYDDVDDLYLTFSGGAWTELATGGSGGGGAEFPDYTDNAGKHLAVNATEDGVEWVTPETGDGGGSSGGGGDLPASWSFGAGDRRTLIGVTCTGGSSGDPTSSLHSSRVNDFYFNAGTTTKVLTFDFRKPLLVQGFATMMDTQQSNGTWTIAGSNDGAAWTDIINDYVMGGAPYGPVRGVDNTGRTYVREFDNNTPYRYIRLTLNAGQSTNNSNYVQHFFFKQQPL